MTRRTQDNLVAAALLVVFGGVVWLCQDFGPRARMIPLPLAIFGIVLTILQIVWQNVRSTDELKMDLIAVDEDALGGAPDGPSQPTKPLSAETQNDAPKDAVCIFRGGRFAGGSGDDTRPRHRCHPGLGRRPR